MKKILTTGGSGFVGKALRKELKECKYNVISLSSKNGDITKTKTWNNVPKTDAVVHLAAKTFVPDSWIMPEEFITVNSIGLINTINYCLKNNSKLIFISSYIYGEPKNLPINENEPLNPLNPYALSKMLGEEICNFYKKRSNLKLIIIRPFNIYGVGQSKKFLIPQIIYQIKEKGKIQVKDLNPKRDYIYIKDIIQAIKKCIDYEGKEYIFNIGSGKSYSVIQIIKIIQSILDTNISIENKNSQRKMEVMETISDNNRANKELGWYPKYTIYDGLEEVILHNKNQ